MRKKVLMQDEVTGQWREEWRDLGAGRARFTQRASKRPVSGKTAGLVARPRAVPRAKYPRGEYVYFLQEQSTGTIKIGCTRRLATRIADLTALNGSAVELLGFIKGYDLTERALHTIFAADRLHGEWFKPSPELVALARGDLVFTPNGLREPRRPLTPPVSQPYVP